MIVSPLLEHPVQAAAELGAAAAELGAAARRRAGLRPAAGRHARAVLEATQDAQADENGTLWFFAGCILGLIGVVIAYVAEPSPPRSD